MTKLIFSFARITNCEIIEGYTGVGNIRLTTGGDKGMYCSKCGKYADDGAVFCSACGASLSNQTSINMMDMTQRKEKKGLAIASMVLGMVGIVAWVIPLIGFPITIVGLVLGIVGLRKDGKGFAIAGLVLSTIFLVLTTANSAIGAYQGFKGELFFQQNEEYEPMIEKTFTIKGNLSKEDSDHLLYILQKRAESFTRKAVVAIDSEDNTVSISLPETEDANRIFAYIVAQSKLEFVANRGTADEEIIVTGANVSKAEVETTEDITGTKQYVVEITFDDEGTRLFAKGTEENIGNAIAIVFNDEVLSNPIVYSAITDGSAQIAGNNSYEEMYYLAMLIDAGSLNVELEEN